MLKLMHFETRITWEKLLLEIRNLQPQDGSAIVPLLVGTHAALAPKEAVEGCFRQLHFLEFELDMLTRDLKPSDRWRTLCEWFFVTCRFRAVWSGELREDELLFKPILTNRVAHPLPLALLFLHFASQMQLTVHLIYSPNTYIVKYVIGRTMGYLDIGRNGQPLREAEVLHCLQKTGVPNETGDARSVYRRYLECLIRLYEAAGLTQTLHSVYNLCLQLDEANLPVLARRAQLRHRLGFAREALSDLKRYFAFVDREHAPIELQRIMIDLESMGEDAAREISSGLLH